MVGRVRAAGGTVVATGGCFDLLHAGHVATLQAARQLGDCLVVCLNSDASVAGLKGPDRPVVPQGDRGRLLAALGCVDAVLIFDEPTPQAALSWLRPDIWVKGGDYATGGGDGRTLPEAEILRRWGGHTVVVPYLDGRSTTDMIAAARDAAAAGRPGGPTRRRARPATAVRTDGGGSTMSAGSRRRPTVLVTGGVERARRRRGRRPSPGPAAGRWCWTGSRPADGVPWVECDLADTRAAEAATRELAERSGGLDAVVTAAGMDVPGQAGRRARRDLGTDRRGGPAGHRRGDPGGAAVPGGVAGQHRHRRLHPRA